MRAVSFQATFVAVLLGSSMAARAGSDNFFADLDKSAVTAPTTESARTLVPKSATPGLDLTPTQSLGDKAPVAAEVSPKAAASVAMPASAKASVKGKADSLDPEPDAAIVPPSAAPSNDPLDALSAPSAAKPAGKADAAKTDKPDPATQPVSPKTDATAEPVVEPSKVVQEPLPAAAAAIKAVLDRRETQDIHGAHAGERRKEREAIAFFYAARGFAPLWSVDGKPVPSVDPVIARLSHAGDDALTIGVTPTALAVQGASEIVAESDVALTEAVVVYARQATGSRVQPGTISPLIGSKPSLADPSEVLDAVAGAGAAAGDKLQAQNPAEPRYVALREKLARIHGAPTPVASVPIPAGPTLKIGMHDARVPLLRARFGLDNALDAEPDEYDEQVATAVADFQRANGLSPSGTLTKRTVAALAGGKPVKLEGALIANMEMWRWMPRDLGADRIEVNIPDYQVTVFHGGATVSQNRVVVGKMETPTPLFSNTMKFLIVNPYWNVPQSIIKNELLPKGGGSLSYLEDRGYSVSSHNGFPVVKQLPGDKNALGRIKFLFPNDYSVYLHDTPSKSLFASTKRAFSHGCVRVDKPFAFAESVLNDAPSDGRKAWSQDRLEDMIGDKERYVNLPAPLPIHIEYFTASVDADGDTVKLRDDVYGYANAVAAALGQSNESIPVAGHSVPKPQVAERARPRRLTASAGAEAAAPPAQTAGRGFWDIFDPR